MKNWQTMKYSLFFLVVLWGELGRAQFGTGIFMGNQPCPYPISIGQGSVSVSDDIRAAREEVQRALGEKRRAEQAWSQLEKYRNGLEKNLNESLKPDIASGVKDYMESKKNKEAANGQKWQDMAMRGGVINSQICRTDAFINGSDPSREPKCMAAISNYGRAYDQAQEALTLKNEADTAYINAKAELERLKNEETLSRARGEDDTSTEAQPGCTYCTEARRDARSSSLTTSQMWRLGLSTAALLGTFFLAKQSIDNRNDLWKDQTRLGYPVPPQAYMQNASLALGLGMPMFAGGVHGALMGGGMGPGSFACAPTIAGAYPWGPGGIVANQMMGGNGYPPYQGGAFDYPSSIYCGALGFPSAGCGGPAMVGLPGGIPANGMINPAMINPWAGGGNPLVGLAPPALPFLGGAGGPGGGPWAGAPGYWPAMGGMGGIPYGGGIPGGALGYAPGGGVGGWPPYGPGGGYGPGGYGPGYAAGVNVLQSIQSVSMSAVFQLRTITEQINRQLAGIMSGSYYTGGAPPTLPYIPSSGLANSGVGNGLNYNYGRPSPFSTNGSLLLGDTTLPGVSGR